MLPDVTAPTAAPLSRPAWARRAEPHELPELMDQPCTYEELRGCLRDLAAVNRLTHGYAPTLSFLDRVAASHETTEPLRILDVGSGGGDMLRTIAHWAAKRKLRVELTGLDLNPHATRAAQEFAAQEFAAQHPSAALGANIQWLTGDVFSYSPDHQPDLVLSALFTHHLSSPDVVRFLRWMESHGRLGWFINDLHRSARAAFWFRFLPILFGWHPFIRYDGPVSLRRAFTPADWQCMLAEAGVTGAEIESHPMNRLCVRRIRELP